MKSINDIIEDVLVAEGGYVNNKSDKGGETCYGITKAVAIKNGFTDNMHFFPKEIARGIYYQQYVVDPGFDKIYLLSPQIAAEIVDTGVNMGPPTAARFLQIALNSLNTGLFVDLEPDGVIGSGTTAALGAFLKARKEKGIDVLLKALNILQGYRYVELAIKDKTQRAFIVGWLDNRVKL